MQVDPAAKEGPGRERLMTIRRNRRKNTVPFDERLQRAAGEARAAAGKLPQGQERDELLKKARQADMAIHLSEWLCTPDLPSSR
jgi:hypothetical protein